MIALSFLGEYVYVARPLTPELSFRDYTASTFGMETQCNAVSKQCNLEAQDGASTPFFCSDAFQGDVSEMDEEEVYPDCTPNCYPNWYLTYFTIRKGMKMKQAMDSLKVAQPVLFRTRDPREQGK
jgi:hypothetical protein